MMVSKMAEIITALVLLSASGDPTVQAKRVDDAKASFERLGFRTETMAGGKEATPLSTSTSSRSNRFCCLEASCPTR